MHNVCFFKQKTAYEMRISDWSSDVCSSDLIDHRHAGHIGIAAGRTNLSDNVERSIGEDFGADTGIAQILWLQLVDQCRLQLRGGQAAGMNLADQRKGDHAAAIDRVFAGQIGLTEHREDRKSTRLNSSHQCASRMPSSDWKQNIKRYT